MAAQARLKCQTNKREQVVSGDLLYEINDGIGRHHI